VYTHNNSEWKTQQKEQNNVSKGGQPGVAEGGFSGKMQADGSRQSTVVEMHHKTAKGNTLTSRQFVELKFLTGSNWDRSLGRQQSLKYGFQTGLSRRIHHNKLTNKNHKKWQKGMD